MKAPLHTFHCRLYRVRAISFLMATVLVCLVAGASRAWADDKSQTEKETPKPASAKTPANPDPSKPVMITGSLIPQNVRRDRVPVTTLPVVIISKEDIQRSGRATVPGVLRQQFGR